MNTAVLFLRTNKNKRHPLPFTLDGAPSDEHAARFKVFDADGGYVGVFHVMRSVENVEEAVETTLQLIELQCGELG